MAFSGSSGPDCVIIFLVKGKGKRNPTSDGKDFIMVSSYIPKYQFEGLMARRYNKRKHEVMVQRKLKSGKWGKALPETVYGNETPEQVVARINELNPGQEFRLFVA